MGTPGSLPAVPVIAPRRERSAPFVVATAMMVVLLAASACTSSATDEAGPTTAAPAVSSTQVPAATTSTHPPAPDPPTLTWTPCRGVMECATLPVPLDWADPAGPGLDVALARRPALDPDARIGSVIFNPGGPGASGLDQLEVGPPVSDEVARRFDLVSWDPRGVGETSPLACDDVVDPWFGTDAAPDDDGERADMERRAEELADDCASRDSALIAHIGTDQTIRDLDQIRRALGDERLNYVGSSYGTYIGQLYAEAYPDEVRAMVLDGIVDPSLDLAGLSTDQAGAFERQLDRMLGTCPRTCPDDPYGTYDELAAAVEGQPIPSRDGTPLDSGALSGAAVIAGYSPALWSTFQRGLAEAEGGDGTLLARLAATHADLAATAPYLAVLCADWETLDHPDQYADLAAELGAEAPRLGATLGFEYLPCAYWPDVSWRDPAPVTAANAPPILLVATTNDPATPIHQARHVAQNLESAVLMTRDGDAHGALGQDRCIDGAVTAYLVDLSLPPADTTC